MPEFLRLRHSETKRLIVLLQSLLTCYYEKIYENPFVILLYLFCRFRKQPNQLRSLRKILVLIR